MPTRRRLDVEMVRRRLAESRESAQRLIAAGRVIVTGAPATKPATMVAPDTAIVVTATPGQGYASRGAYKLAGALEVFLAAGMLPVQDRDCLDAGASTGGFTDVLLRAGARSVTAVDVGYGQLHWRLRSDPRVHVLDRMNVRHLEQADLRVVPAVVVADLSFISLRLVLPALVRVAAADADLVVMVKPQFEVGADRIGRKGVVTDPQTRVGAVRAVHDVAVSLGWGAHGVAASQLPGPAGNREYFLWLRRGAPTVAAPRIDVAVREGTNT